MLVDPENPPSASHRIEADLVWMHADPLIAGKQYLIDHGMTADALLLEEQGTNTWESLRNAVPLARANRIGAVLLVSDPFHMLRSIKMARDLGLIAYGSPTRSSPIAAGSAEETRYILREAWAYMVYLFARE